MNWLDIVILCLAGAGLLKGLYDGMIKQVVALAAMIIGIYLCAGAAEWVHGYLIKLEWFPQKAVVFASYFLGFIVIAGVIMLAGNLIHRLVSSTPLSLFNHLTGGILGLILTIIFTSFFINILELFDKNSVLLSQEVKVESRLYIIVKNIIPEFFPGSLFDIKI